MTEEFDRGSALDKFDIADRVAIVTGGAGLLGRSHALTLASAGAAVVIADVRKQAAQDAADDVRAATGRGCLPLTVDVSDAESVRTMVYLVLERYGRIDILVNNAALDPKFDREHAGGHSTSFEEFSLEAWQQAMDVNVTGMFLCAQAVAPTMVEAGQGVIVNVSSTYGIVGPDQRLYQREGQPLQIKPVTYSVAKAAALGLTRYLATYFAGKGIRVNALTPGGVFADHDDEFVRRYSAKTVLGRMAEKEEISSALLFLVSDASSYMTGANLVVDGGWTAW
ncbi:MAG: SDR family oxidoreductase [Chloroflexi bacterium]|nr:SDR family oxidoreductase [Chloroflexota bacterium]